MTGDYIINNVNFSPVIAPDGVRQLYIERRARSVVTMNGAKRSWSVPKRVLEFDLVAIRASSPNNFIFRTPARRSEAGQTGTSIWTKFLSGWKRCSRA